MSKRIIPISLALILLMSNISLTYAVHYCGGYAVESKVALGLPDVGCGMTDMDKCSELPLSVHQGVNSIPCCLDDIRNIHFHADYSLDTHQANTFQVLNPALSEPIILLSIDPAPVQRFYADYLAPPITRDIQVLFHSYLI